MARVTLFSAYDLTDPPFWTGTTTVASETTIVVQNSRQQAEYRGDFVYGWSGTVTGELQSYRYQEDGRPIFAVTGGRADAADMFYLINVENDAQAALALFLDGRDTVRGSSGADRITGFADNDALTGGRGADDFVFTRGMGRDRVTDFGTGADGLVLDSSLWRGDLTAAQVVRRFAEDTGDDIVLDFGRRGQITLEDLASVQGLAGLIEII